MAKSYEEEEKSKVVMGRHELYFQERFPGSQGDNNFLTIAKVLNKQESSHMMILLYFSGGSYTSGL